MGQELRIKNYELRRGFIFLFLTSYFLLLLLFVAVPPAFGAEGIVPTDCYDQGDYSLGSFLDIAQNVMKFIWSISGAFALLMFFFGGILWLVSAGEDKRVTQGRETMMQAATGLIIVLGSWVFINYVVAALKGGSIGDDPATIFNKSWSEYNDGPCLTSYWQRAFPILSPPAPACSGAPLANISPYATCDLACKARNHLAGSMVGGVCCCTGTAPPPPPAGGANMDEVGNCCINHHKTVGEVACTGIPPNPDPSKFWPFPSRSGSDNMISNSKKRRDCPSQSTVIPGATPISGMNCHAGNRMDAVEVVFVDAEQLRIDQLFCGQQTCGSANGQLSCH